MRIKMKRLLGILLSLALVLGLIPGMSLTAYAAPTETLLTTITATGDKQASYSTANVATVSFSHTAYGSSSYTATWGWWGYGWIATVTPADGYTITKCMFYDNENRTATDSSSPFVVETTEEDKTPKVNGTILADQSKGIKKIEVYGYASKAAQTITAEDVTVTYGDTDKSVSASVTEPTTGGGAITYAVKDGSGDYIDVAADGKLTIKKVPPTDGKAYIIVKAAATDDYAETTKEVTVTISKAEATVTAKDQSIMVGGTVPDLSAPVLNTHYSVTGLVGTDALTTAPTLAYQKNGEAATPDSATAGTYDIVPSGASAGDNYNISYTNGTLTITAKDAQTITASDVTATYGDTDKSVSASTNGNGEISYAVKSGSEDYIDVASDGKLTINKVPAEGKAYVTVTAAETTTGGTGGNGYAAATKDVTVNISKATVTITAKDQSIYVGGTVPTLSGADFYTVTGLVGTDTLTTAPTLAYQKNGSAAAPDNTAAGTYDIVASGATASDNYTITYANGTLTISDKGTQSITADDVTVTYGDTDKKVSASVTDPTEGGVISYAVKEGSGDYIDVDATTGALTIKKVPTDGKAYVTVTAAGTAAHEQATKDVTVTINKANSTVTKAPTAKTLTYNGQAQELVTAGTAEGGTMYYALGEDATTAPADNLYTTSIPTATTAGTYYVWYKASGNSDYEESEPGCVEVTIREDGQPDNDEGNINVETRIEEGAPDCGLEVPDDTLDSLLTEEEKERLNNGEAVLFYLDVSNTDPSETDKSLIESKLKEISSDAQVGMFFDMSFYKQVGNSDPEKITDLNGKKVNVLIDVPKELQNAESGKTRIFYVVRIHNGVAEIIAESTKTPIPVESDKFSTYAILYEDVEKSTGSSYEHHHHICEHGHIFNYHVFQEPTTETDGYAGWVCDRCGIQDPDHADYVGPTGYIVLSAFPVFNDTLEKNIAAAPENGTVSISTKRWMSVRRGVLEALAARPDVTLSISFAYENEDYVLTIKGSDPNLAGFTASGDLFYGFIYLGNGFGLEKKTAEVPQS